MSFSSSSIKNYLDRFLDIFDPTPARTSTGWLAKCPCPDHGAAADGDTHPSLHISVGSGGAILVHCRVGCTSTAVLGALGVDYRNCYPPEGELPVSSLTSSSATSVEFLSPAQILERHLVYSELLSLSPLSDDDKALLISRGIDSSSLFSYGSLIPANLNTVLGLLSERLGLTPLVVPGFSLRSGGRLGLSLSTAGIWVPVRHFSGDIVALKLRANTTSISTQPRYLYLSQPVSSGTPAHFPLADGYGFDWLSNLSVVRVTEGEFKAEICQQQTGIPTLSIPGVSLWSRALPYLAAYPPEKVILALDWPDVESRYPIYTNLVTFIRELAALGIPVELEVWTGPPKGLDDLLVSGRTPDVIPVVEVSDYLSLVGAKLLRGTAVSIDVDFTTLPDATVDSYLDFPIDAFPSPIADYLTQVARTVQVPVDFPALSCLTVAATAIGASRVIQLRNGWSELPILYSVLVAPPGARKTPVFRRIMAPLIAHQQTFHDEFYKEIALYDVMKEKVLAARAAKVDSGYVVSDKPRLTHLYVQDATVEALCELLVNNPRGILLYRDELSGWVKSMNAYRSGEGADRQFYLSLWSAEPIKVDRKGNRDRPLHLSRPCVSVLGGIQPDMLNELVDRKGREDGFFHRLLFVAPRMALPACWSEDEDLTSSDHWSTAVSSLLALTDQATLCLSPEALDLWVSWYNAHHDEIRSPDFPQEFWGPWSKHLAYCARLALILHLLHQLYDTSCDWLEASTKEISATAMSGAIALIRYFQKHYQKIHSLLHGAPSDAKLPRLLDFLKKQPDGQAAPRKIQRSLHFATRTATDELLKRAADLGVVEEILLPPIAGRKLNVVYRLASYEKLDPLRLAK